MSTTKEQIKQNAEEYAKDEKQYYLEIGCYDLIREAYIAGAHSRDPEIEDLKADLAKVKKEKELLGAAFKIVQSELDRLKWNDASEVLPPREVDSSYSILVATLCDDSKENYYLDRYDYQAKKWIYNSKSKVLKWRIEK